MKKSLAILSFVFSLLSASAQKCPTSIVVEAPFSVTAGEVLSFIVQVKGTDANMTYNWSISAGIITSGQGTSSITVETDSIGGMTSTATVELGGLPRECSSVASSTVDILMAPKKIISVKYTTPAALSAPVKKFIKEADLSNPNGSQTGFIYIYKGATTTPVQFTQIKKAVTNAFIKNNILSYQYKIADGGKKKVATIEMYSVAQGAKEPVPSK